MSGAYDAVVVGAGHNGMVAAAYLAKAGQRVLVLERREIVGGAAVSEELHPGFRFDTGAHRVQSLHPAVARDLNAIYRASGSDPQTARSDPDDGVLQIIACDPTVFAPGNDGEHLLLWRKSQAAAKAIASLSEADSRNWEGFTTLISTATALLKSVYRSAPPDVLSRQPRDLLQLVQFGRRLRRLGKRDMMEVLRLLPMTVTELLNEWFESDLLKGVLGAVGITGTSQGPMASGTAYLFLHHHVGVADGAIRPTYLVRGGMGAFTRALETFCRDSGVTIRTNAWVDRILTREGRTTAVVLASGEEIQTQRVVSNADPRRTFLQLLDPIQLDPEFVRKVQNIRYRGVCAKVNLALAELPNFTSLPGDGHHLRGTISISPSLTYLERAFDDAKYGDLSREPYLEAVIPSLSDPALAPAGQHVMSILVQYAPYNLLEGSWDDEQRQALGDRVIETLSRYAPNIESAILHRQILTPRDLESAFGLTEGNIYHGEMTLDQLFFMRPVPGWSRYRTPIKGLYLCGAGTHPGGGVTGAPGFNAARTILEDLSRNK